MSTVTLRSREVERLVTGTAVSDGAGVRLLRVLTQDLQRRLDPFLMLDEFRSDNPDDYLAGFPDHPHRGFQLWVNLPAAHKMSAPDGRARQPARRRRRDLACGG